MTTHSDPRFDELQISGTTLQQPPLEQGQDVVFLPGASLTTRDRLGDVLINLTSAGEIVQDQLNNELQQCRTLLTLRTKENQNENTSKSYAPKQVEWRAWCTQKGYADGDIVTKDKIVLFLTTEIEGRLRKKGDKTKVVGSSTVEQYLNSLLDLY
jgi:hypothetical protein